jgi:ankyrin repeat protein
MMEQAVLNAARQMSSAIRCEDLECLTEVVREHPEQLHFNTPMGAQTWLGYAVRMSSIAVVQHLINLGFDVNEGDSRDGVKPICSACYEGRHDVTRLLLDAGSALDTATSAQNPLFAAIVGRSPDVVKLLLERGMDASVRYNSKTMKNMDAVAFALMQGEIECARIIALWNSKGDELAAQAALRQADQIAEENAFRKS